MDWRVQVSPGERQQEAWGNVVIQSPPNLQVMAYLLKRVSFRITVRLLRHFEEFLRIRPLQSEAPRSTKPWGNLPPHLCRHGSGIPNPFPVQDISPSQKKKWSDISQSKIKKFDMDQKYLRNQWDYIFINVGHFQHGFDKALSVWGQDWVN